MLIYEKESESYDGQKILFASLKDFPMESDDEVWYTLKNLYAEISPRDIKNYKEFVTKNGCVYAKNYVPEEEGDVVYSDGQIYVWAYDNITEEDKILIGDITAHKVHIDNVDDLYEHPLMLYSPDDVPYPADAEGAQSRGCEYIDRNTYKIIGDEILLVFADGAVHNYIVNGVQYSATEKIAVDPSGVELTCAHIPLDGDVAIEILAPVE